MTLDLPSFDEKEIQLDLSWATNLVKRIQDRKEKRKEEQDSPKISNYTPLFSKRKEVNNEETHNKRKRGPGEEIQISKKIKEDHNEESHASQRNDHKLNGIIKRDTKDNKESHAAQENDHNLNGIIKRDITVNNKESNHKLNGIIKKDKTGIKKEISARQTETKERDTSENTDGEKKLSRKKQKELIEQQKKKDKKKAEKERKKKEKEEENKSNESEATNNDKKEEYEIVHVYEKKNKDGRRQEGVKPLVKPPKLSREFQEILASQERIKKYELEKETENDGDDESEIEKEKPSFGSVEYTSENDLSQFHPKKKKREMITLEKKLEKAEKREKALSEDSKQGENLREIHVWKRVMEKEQGVKTQTQTSAFLKQAMKRVKKRKEKSRTQWEERDKAVVARKEAKQNRRERHLKIKKEMNLEKRINKRFGVRTQSKKEKRQKAKNNKNRPGFEGRKRNFINK